MKDQHDVPQWLTDFIALWIGRLNLHDWHVYVKVVTRIDGWPEADALCCQFPETNRATISLMAGIEDCPEDRINVIHELLHISHGRIDRTIENVIMPVMPDATQEIAMRAYRDAYESYIHRLAESWYSLAEPWDYATEITED